MQNPRVHAAKIIWAVIKGQSLDSVLAAYTFPSADQAFIKDLVYGSLRYYHQLLAITQLLSEKPLTKKEKLIEVTIILGLYQLLYQQQKDHAAVNETVEVVKTLKKPWAVKLVNAILRRFLREKDEIMATIQKDRVAKYSSPLWLIKTMKEAWPEDWQTHLEANNQRAPMCLRVNQQKTTRENYLALLDEKEMKGEPHPFSKEAIVLEHPCAVLDLPHFLEGWVSVQDAAAQLAAGLIDGKDCRRLLDACAAPGGKLMHCMESYPNIQSIVGIDKQDKRLEKVRENIQRLGLPEKKVTYHAVDAKAMDSWWDGELFDRILVDAPCSGTGVIRRHPDIKILRRESDIAALADEQRALLENLWPPLNAGGLLLYATCSILPKENDELVRGFLQDTPSAHAKQIEASWGLAGEFGRTIVPGESGMDGFYYSMLVKE